MAFDSNTARLAGKKSSRAGKPNKATAEIRDFLSNFLAAELGQVMDDMAGMEPKDRVNAWIKLAEFVLPKLTRTHNEITGPDGTPIQTVIRFVDDSKDEEILPTIETKVSTSQITTPGQIEYILSPSGKPTAMGSETPGEPDDLDEGSAVIASR